jgi:hypothetical protein
MEDFILHLIHGCPTGNEISFKYRIAEVLYWLYTILHLLYSWLQMLVQFCPLTAIISSTDIILCIFKNS